MSIHRKDIAAAEIVFSKQILTLNKTMQNSSHKVILVS